MPTLLVSPCRFTAWRRGRSTGAHRSTEGRPQALQRAAGEPGEPRATASVPQLLNSTRSRSALKGKLRDGAPSGCLLSPGEVFTCARGLDLHLQPQAVVTKEPAHLRKWLRERAVVTPSATAPATSPWAEERSHRRAQPPPRKASSPTGQTVGDASHTLTGPCVASQPEPKGGASATGPLAARYRL